MILGYGQFGVITEATLKVRPYTPLRMHYFYYSSLRTAIEDLQLLDRNDASDYSGILTIMDCAVNLLVAFDSPEREAAFQSRSGSRACAGTVKSVSRCARLASLRAASVEAARGLVPATGESANSSPSSSAPNTCADGVMLDRTVVFSRAVWKFWGSRQMVIPDLATSAEKFVDAVERGNAVCRKYFPHYTLYCVGIRLRPEHRAHYEMSCIPPDAQGWAYGCEFEPMTNGRDLQPRPPAIVQERDLRHRRRHGRELLPLRRHDERLYPPRVRRCAGGPPPGDEARGRPGDDPQPRRDFLMFGVRKHALPRKDYAACSGCSLCLLVCPVWRQTHDLRLTPHGRAKALQHGATVADITESIESLHAVRRVRAGVPGTHRSRRNDRGPAARAAVGDPQSEHAIPIEAVQPTRPRRARRTHCSRRAPALRDRPRTLARVVGAAWGIAVATTMARTSRLRWNRASPIPPKRLERSWRRLRGARTIVVADGLLHASSARLVAARAHIVGLGEALSSSPPCGRGLRTTDLYVIEPRAYHARLRAPGADTTTRLRVETGCAFNLDLQRIAIPATARSLPQRLGRDAPDDAEQTRWILHGRTMSRIVVESLDDSERSRRRRLSRGARGAIWRILKAMRRARHDALG